jgi:phage baseplate assembly protein gpV
MDTDINKALLGEKKKRQQLVYMEAQTNCPELRPGDVAKMNAWMPENKTYDTSRIPVESYFLIEVIHRFADGEGYSNSFTGVPRDLFVPPNYDMNDFPKAQIQHATVTDNKDPEKMGRVRVQFPWQKAGNQQTPWIQVIQPHAGAGKGTYINPEINETVLCAFQGGNVDCPIVLGTAYNGGEIATYYTDGNDIKVIQTRSGTKRVANDAEGSILEEDAAGSFIKLEGDGRTKLKCKFLDIEVEQDMKVTVGNQAIWEVMQKILVNTPFMQQLISDYYHTQAGKALINSENEIKIEARETNVAGTQKLFMHSDESAVVNSKGTAELKGEAKNNYTNASESYDTVKEEIAAKCMVQFRPHNNWNGEYGLDWTRMGDTGRNPGDTQTYFSIVGKNRDASGNISNNNYGNNIVADVKEYTKLLKKYKVLSVPFTKDFYIVPWLSLYKDKTAKFSLKLHIENPPKKLEFKYDKSLFQLNHEEITKKEKGKHTLPDYLTVKCIKTFNADQNIDVYADGLLAGRLKVHKNGKVDRRKLSVVLARVKFFTTEGDITGEETKLKKYLGQALITPHVIVDNSVNLSKDAVFIKNFTKGGNIVYSHDSNGRGTLHNYMISNYNLAGKYPGAFIIYVFELPCPGTGGEAFDIPSNNALVFEYKSRKATCLVHEFLHGMGLYHTFDNNSTFTFPKNITENIMDYTNARYALWKWQWDLIRTNSMVKKE